MPVLSVSLVSSRFYCGLLIGLACSTVLALLFAPISPMASGLLIVLFCFCFYRFYRWAAVGNKGVKQVSYCEDVWELKRGECWHDAVLSHVQCAWPGLIVLFFEIEPTMTTTSKKIVLPIFFDMLDTREFRQLCTRVHLRSEPY